MSQQVTEASTVGQVGFVGAIPIKNLWLLLLYASDLYRFLDKSKVSIEDNPDSIVDLVAEVLTELVQSRLLRNLSQGYEQRSENVTRVRGRINLLETERKHLLQKGLVNCSYESLTMNTERNRYVCAALEHLIKLGVNAKNTRRCRSLSKQLQSAGVSKVKPVNYCYQNERFGRHDLLDQKMVAAAHLVFTLSIPTEMSGSYQLPSPERQIEWLRKLFEKAIAGFYATVLVTQVWQVQDGKKLNWAIEEQSTGIAQILPSMKTDIIVSHRPTGNHLIIDTKFNAITKPGWYKEQTLRSGYLYQMYAYLRSQEDLNKPETLSSAGMLLHPAIGSDVMESAKIQGHTLYFCTLDLTQDAANIRARLLWLIGVWESGLVGQYI